MKDFYNKIIEVFEKQETKDKFSEKEVSPVQYIDIYAGQEQDEDNFELFAQNALLIDWDIDYQGDVPIASITFYCCFEQMRDISNISLNRAMGLKFLDYIEVIDEIATTIESAKTGKLEIVSEGFHKMDSIVDIYLLTYECSYVKRKSPLDEYQEGDYDKLNLKGNFTYEMD